MARWKGWKTVLFAFLIHFVAMTCDHRLNSSFAKVFVSLHFLQREKKTLSEMWPRENVWQITIPARVMYFSIYKGWPGGTTVSACRQHSIRWPGFTSRLRHPVHALHIPPVYTCLHLFALIAGSAYSTFPLHHPLTTVSLSVLYRNYSYTIVLILLPSSYIL